MSLRLTLHGGCILSPKHCCGLRCRTAQACQDETLAAVPQVPLHGGAYQRLQAYGGLQCFAYQLSCGVQPDVALGIHLQVKNVELWAYC
jgi:hypothetical protein